MNKKFFVLFCPKHIYHPEIHSVMSIIQQKIKNNPSLAYQQFPSEIQAQKFIYPLKINYLTKVKHQMAQFQTSPPTNEFPATQLGNQKQKSQQVGEDGNFLQMMHSMKDEQGSGSEKSGQNFQTITKNIKDNQHVRANIKIVYQQILSYLGNPKQFTKSMVRISIKSGIKYYALFDGCAKGNPGYSGIGYSVMNEKGTVIFERSLNIGIRTNNQAEFFALVCCLLDCKYNNISRLNVYGDSELVVKGVNGKYKIEDQKLKYYNLLAKYLSKSFEEFLIQHIPRSKNQYADKLANQGIGKKCLSNKIFKYI